MKRSTSITSLMYLVATLSAGAGNALAGSDPTLQTGTWALVQIQSMDDKTYTPATDDAFTLSFGDDGTVSAKVDCNRGSGTYKSESPGQLLFGPLATTRALCGPNSIDSRYLKDLEYVRSYVFRQGKLYLATMADGAILEFRQLSATAKPTFDCAKAQGKVETSICADPSLAALDVKLDTQYQRALESLAADDLATLKTYQRGWIKGRNDCWKAHDLNQCVTFAYQSRITELQVQNGSQRVPSPVLFDCDDGAVLTAYFYPDTELPSAVLNKHPNQVTALASADGSYEAANVSFRQQDETASLSWLGAESQCRLQP